MGEVPVGGVVRFHYPDAHTPCLLIRLDEATWVAYDQQCTHLSCPVIPRPEAGQLHCPCHEGAFDLTTGRPVAGPPRRPLRRVRLKVRDDRIYAVALEEKIA